MKPQRALIIATLVTLLIGLGAVVVATTMSNPGGNGTEESVVPTTTAMDTTGDPGSLDVETENQTSYPVEAADRDERDDQSGYERLDHDSGDDEEGDELHDDD